MIKLGIIGAGSIVDAHIRASNHVGFSPVAIVARNNSKSVYKYSDTYPDMKPCKDLEEFFRQDFDAILIATSEEAKADMLNHALHVKKPILIEKPVLSENNYDQIKNINNLEFVKVAYNRRNYSSVEKFNSEIKNISTGLIQINIPELSWSSTPKRELVKKTAYTNSVHIIDLLGYLLPNFGITKIIRDKNNFNRIINFEDERFIGTINLTFGIPDTYSFKVQSSSRIIELEPIEKFNSFSSIAKTGTSEHSSYSKISDSNWKTSEHDSSFKPGFVRQYIEFSKCIKNPSIKTNLASILDDEKAFHTMKKIMEII